jgi:hypothetical protein
VESAFWDMRGYAAKGTLAVVDRMSRNPQKCVKGYTKVTLRSHLKRIEREGDWPPYVALWHPLIAGPDSDRAVNDVPLPS